MSTTTTRVDPAAVRDFYDRNGYYVFRNALSRDAINAVHDCLERARATHIRPQSFRRRLECFVYHSILDRRIRVTRHPSSG